MAVNPEKTDVRRMKTAKALYAAMYSLLESYPFGKITVKRICERALVSRAAFYVHYTDKYDLLRDWFANSFRLPICRWDTFEQMETQITPFMRHNRHILRNLLHEVDAETMEVLFDSVLFTIELKRPRAVRTEVENIVLSNFYVGGMIFYVLWHVRNRFPESVPVASPLLHEVISRFGRWKDENTGTPSGDSVGA